MAIPTPSTRDMAILPSTLKALVAHIPSRLKRKERTNGSRCYNSACCRCSGGINAHTAGGEPASDWMDFRSNCLGGGRKNTLVVVGGVYPERDSARYLFF